MLGFKIHREIDIRLLKNFQKTSLYNMIKSEGGGKEMKIPFGRLMLFSLITSILFALYGLFLKIPLFITVYHFITSFSLRAAAICFILWLAITLFCPSSLFEPGQSIGGIIYWLDDLFYGIPWFRISLLTFFISLILGWLSAWIFSIAITISLVSFEMFIARILFFTYGSAGR